MDSINIESDLETLENFLKKDGLFEYINRIDESLIAGATSTEIYIRLLPVLKDIKKNNENNSDITVLTNNIIKLIEKVLEE